MLKFTVSFVIEEDQLKDIFESYDIKYTKKKLKELKEYVKDNEYIFEEEMADDFERVVGDMVSALFDE
jgi:hypothetical protein